MSVTPRLDQGLTDRHGSFEGPQLLSRNLLVELIGRHPTRVADGVERTVGDRVANLTLVRGWSLVRSKVLDFIGVRARAREHIRDRIWSWHNRSQDAWEQEDL